VDKPAGPTSHDAVARVRRALGVRTLGHTGTLDPFASGLLLLLAGRATRVARFIDGLPKTYVGVARLGLRTDTDDRTGAPLGEPADLGGLVREQIKAAVEAMVGSYPQRPPAYSAKKVRGVRSYRRARRGEAVVIPDVPISVYGAELLELAGDRVTFRVKASTGTYVRALARDLGERLGVGAHLAELRREAIGTLRVEHAVPLAEIRPGTPLVPLTRVLEHLPALALDDAQRSDVRHGRRLRGGGADGQRAREPVVLTAGGEVVAVARAEAGYLQPVVVLEGE
jgi:tRNA pseudouridine55 synthase